MANEAMMAAGGAAGRRGGVRGFAGGAWGMGILLVVVTVAVFLPVICGGGFFWTDDYDLLVNNRLVKAGDGLWRIWFSRENPDYFPLMSTSFWLEWRVWGTWAPGYHVTNVLLHIGSSLMLWRIFGRLGVWGAFGAALVFAIHPVNVESVAWIAERKNTLSMFFLCASVLLYLRWRQGAGGRGAYWGAVVMFALALLSKTAPVMLPVVLLLLAWRERGRIGWADVRGTAPFFVLSLVMGLVTVWFQYGTAIGDTMVRTDSLVSRTAGAGWAVWFYLGKALFPVGITFNYPRWDVMAWGVWAFGPLAALAGVFVLLWMYRRSVAGREMLAGLGSYVVMLAPVLGFLNIFFMRYSLVSDHWQYMAMPCVIAAAVAGAVWVYQRARLEWRRGLAVGGVVLVAVLAVDSATVAAVYRTSETVWEDTVAHNPGAFLAHMQLGDIHFKRAMGRTGDAAKEMERAVGEFRAAVALRPEMAMTWTNLGNAYASMAPPRVDEALEAYNKAVEARDTNDGDRAYLQLNIGVLMARSGNLPAAEKRFREAVWLNPKLKQGYVYLETVIGSRGGAEGETVAAMEGILKKDPVCEGARRVLEKVRELSH